MQLLLYVAVIHCTLYIHQDAVTSTELSRPLRCLIGYEEYSGMQLEEIRPDRQC
ncbi:hypothetical protein FTV88_1036 [Heliorestis convoluta]|uniref:Uncharacterized protein n=1 Tax=Heliorestis convoluta TaxID=356322 RepID=A0A5Q2MX85_9FIRM|nr:hypothetical protein FTV88_1036 [Heliorestis convoluta]